MRQHAHLRQCTPQQTRQRPAQKVRGEQYDGVTKAFLAPCRLLRFVQQRVGDARFNAQRRSGAERLLQQ